MDTPPRQRLLVVAALVERDGAILMSQRRADQTLPLMWELPGGKVEPGESPEAALRREIDEELGCTVTVGRIDDVVFHAYERFDLVMLVYRCEVSGGEPYARAVADVRFVPRAEITSLPLPPADQPIAQRLARGG